MVGLDLAQQYLTTKQRILEKEYKFLNSKQREAVFRVQGALLILAGAGSGKTTVLVNRIAYLLLFGNAYFDSSISPALSTESLSILKKYDNGEQQYREQMLDMVAKPFVKPWNVLAITFTNKAANELKQRLVEKLGEVAHSLNCGTFHSVCVRILRQNISVLGYRSSFTIYDSDDSLLVIKDCMAGLEIDDVKMFHPKAIRSEISRLKDQMVMPIQAQQQAGNDYRLRTIADIYQQYQKTLQEANAVDFDDIILLTVQLFQQDQKILQRYQQLFQYIVVDEYQDTNHLQYQLVGLLAKNNQNICVVGDDDQSIYKFRGATIKNILNFEQQYQEAVVIRLEQNYRSTKNILDAANGIIQHNQERKAKTLWTDHGTGNKIKVFRAKNDFDENDFIIGQIQDNVREGSCFANHAILYRMNMQSNMMERALIKGGISYHIVGGTKFFDRKEIKDMLAYFHVIHNSTDNLRLKRIINEPKRGIGKTTIATLETIAEQASISVFDVMKTAEDYPMLASKKQGLMEFAHLIEQFQQLATNEPLDVLLDELMDKTGYRKLLETQGVEGRVRQENIDELKSNLVMYMEEYKEQATLGGFLEEVSLYTDLDELNASDDRVVLMTIHAAKGLEFDMVFVIGMEDGLFPGHKSIKSSDPKELEEERRLAYVAITRAKQKLYFTCTKQRMLFGQTMKNPPSRFLDEIPPDLIDHEDHTLVIDSQMDCVQRPKPNQTINTPPSGFKAEKPTLQIDCAEGDKVSHKVFGTGMVLSIKPMGNDALIEVAFDRVGTKKIMNNFAKLEKQS